MEWLHFCKIQILCLVILFEFSTFTKICTFLPGISPFWQSIPLCSILVVDSTLSHFRIQFVKDSLISNIVKWKLLLCIPFSYCTQNHHKQYTCNLIVYIYFIVTWQLGICRFSVWKRGLQKLCVVYAGIVNVKFAWAGVSFPDRVLSVIRLFVCLSDLCWVWLKLAQIYLHELEFN
jgi:hypothetical protein